MSKKTFWILGHYHVNPRIEKVERAGIVVEDKIEEVKQKNVYSEPDCETVDSTKREVKENKEDST